MSNAMKPEDLKSYRTILIALQERLKGDVEQMTDNSLNGHSRDASGMLSNVPLHLADLGTENFDQEFTLGLIENDQETLDRIGLALDRIDTGSYGKCTECAQPIARARLQALPYTPHCIECARRMEAAQ